MYCPVITHCDKCAILFVVDCSLSMRNLTRFSNTVMTKRNAAAIIVNHFIEELLARATRHDYVRDYYDIGVIGYSGSESFPLLELDNDSIMVSITRLKEYMPQPQSVYINQLCHDETSHVARFNIPFWIEPTASGESPVYDAMVMTKSVIEKWCNDPKNQHSNPPIVIHISDGVANDADDIELQFIADDIKSIAINGKGVLFINVYLSTIDEGDNNEELFPQEQSFATGDSDKMFLYKISSSIPDYLEAPLSQLLDGDSDATHRAFAANISPISILSLINIGTNQPIVTLNQ